MCDYLDFLLNPGMQNLKSYLKGTKDFLLWVEKLKVQYPELPPLFSILTMDFKAMYPSMPDELVMLAVKGYLNSKKVRTPSTEKTLQLLEIVKNNNYMEFGEKLFQQDGGTSIGKKHAPPLACLGAGKIESDSIYPSQLFQELFLDDKENNNVEDRFWKRFIDDIIAVMHGTREEAKVFVDWMNSLWTGIEFTFEWSDQELTYLDVNLIMRDGRLETDRYIKPTNPQLYLHHTSNHPPQVFKAIVYGQAITVKTICSKEEFVSKHMDNFKQKFLERGYPLEIVNSNLARGAALDREDLLKPKFYPSQASPAVPSKPKFIPTFIITYNPHNPPLKEWLKETFMVLQSDQNMRKIYERLGGCENHIFYPIKTLPWEFGV